VEFNRPAAEPVGAVDGEQLRETVRARLTRLLIVPTALSQIAAGPLGMERGQYRNSLFLLRRLLHLIRPHRRSHGFSRDETAN
jgi:hypothetical protein